MLSLYLERSDYSEVTIWWNEVTKGWNEVAWNEVTVIHFNSSANSSIDPVMQSLAGLDFEGGPNPPLHPIKNERSLNITLTEATQLCNNLFL